MDVLIEKVKKIDLVKTAWQKRCLDVSMLLRDRERTKTAEPMSGILETLRLLNQQMSESNFDFMMMAFDKEFFKTALEIYGNVGFKWVPQDRYQSAYKFGISFDNGDFYEFYE